MATQVTPGTRYSFTNASGGRVSGNFNVSNSYNVSDRSEQASIALPLTGDDLYAWAEVFKTIKPTGSGKAVATVTGSWSSSLTAVATGVRARQEIFLYNVTDNRPVSNNVLSDVSISTDSKKPSGSYSRDVSGNVSSGKTYRIGVRTDAWGKGFFPAYGSASGSNQYSKIALTWAI